MSSLFYRNRQTGQLEEEKIYGGAALRFLYGPSRLSRYVGNPVAQAIAHSPWVSKFFGWWKRHPRTKRQVLLFMQHYGIKAEDCLADPTTYASFDAFFTRQLRPEARPIVPQADVAIIPADGRYRVFPVLNESTLFSVKGSTFDLAHLLKDPERAKRYLHGSMIVARLAPCDYHRFHFPCDCTPQAAQAIKGSLHSVNPLALKRKPAILWQNKRVLTCLDAPVFGEVLYIEVGATNVGTIHQTYTPGNVYAKGDEKGYFSFGGSTLILLFEKGRITLDADLLTASQNDEEMLCMMGQSMGRANAPIDMPT